MYFVLIDDTKQWEHVWPDPHACMVTALEAGGDNLTFSCEDGPSSVIVEIASGTLLTSQAPLVVGQSVEIQMHYSEGIDSWTYQALVVRDPMSSALLLALYHGPSALPLSLLAPISVELGTSSCPFDDDDTFCADDPCCGTELGCYQTRHAATFTRGDDSIEIWSGRDGALPGYDISVGRIVSYADNGVESYAFGVSAQL